MSANGGKWFVKHDGAGHIVVNNESRDIAYVIDASNPLLDESIVQFWRTFDGPRHIAMEVEMLADAYRRWLVSSPHWDRIVAEASTARERQVVVDEERLVTA